MDFLLIKFFDFILYTSEEIINLENKHNWR